MTFNEAMTKIYLETVGASLSPFGCYGNYRDYEVPCCKLQHMDVTYIMFVDKTGAICLWSWNYGDPVRITEADLSNQVREADTWRIETWYTDDSPYNVSDWYKENGWQIQ